jgi:hypothetical protein
MPIRPRSGFPSKHRNHILDRNHEETIVPFEINRDALLRVEEHSIVLLDRIILVTIDLATDRDDPPGQGRYLDLVREMNPDLGDLLVLILPNEHTHADRLDNFDGVFSC